MKKSKLRILLSTSLIIALATTATLVATSLKSKFKRRQYEQEDNIDKLKEKFNRSKSKLDNLIKSNEAKDVDKQAETDILNNTNLTDKDLIKDIESKTKTIEDAIESLTKKINDKKDSLLNDFNDAKKKLQDLIDSQDAQKVDTSKANQSLQNNNVDASSTTDQIVDATTEIKKATQDLQKLIDAAKEKAKQDFNSKKQQLDDLIKSNEAKDVDKQQETGIFNNTNLSGNDLIKDIESKTKTIEDAIKSLTKKINDKKDSLLNDFNDAKKKLQDLIDSQDGQKVDTSKANQSLQNNNVDASSTTDQIVDATTEIKKATQDLQKLIDAAKEKAKQDFNSKKQQLDDLIKSNEAKDVDKQQETGIFNNTNLSGNDLIKDIESKTKTIEDAIKSLTKKINDKKDNLLKDFNDAKKQLEDLIDSQDGQKVDTSKANQSLQNNNADASSTTDQIVNATNEIKKATQDLQKLIDAAKENAKQEFNSKKQQLDNLIKSNEAKDVDKQPETDILNNTNLTGKDLIKDIESKTKTIEYAIESLTKKINDKKNQKDNLLKDFNDAKKQLEDLINSQDAQKVDTSKANQSLQNNNVDASSTTDQIVDATTEIKKATQDLQKLIDAAKEQAKQDFNSKKQQLDDLIKSNEAKDVDKQAETDIFNNTNLTVNDLIKDIESKTKTIEDAIESLTKKINDKKNQKDNLLKDFNDAKKKLQDLIDSQDGQKVDTSKANQSLQNNNADASSTTDQIVNATNEIKKATQDLQKLIDAAKEQAKQDFNSKKQQLDNLIKSNEAKDVDKQQETDIFNNTNLTGKDLIKDIESKTKTIEDAIKSLTNKINDKKDNLLKDFNDAKKQLKDLIDSQDGQKVDTSKENQSLQNNNADASSTTDQIVNVTNEIKKATQDLQKLIDAAKEQAKQDFNSKKQQLDNLIKSNEAKDVDKQPETDIFNNTNLTGKDLIKDIESKTKTIEDAIESLTKKINDKKDNLLKDFNDAKKQLKDLIDSQDGQKVDTSKANQSLQNNNADASSTSDQIINATNEIKKATQDLQKLIDAAKEKAKQDFNSKKQQLDNLIKSNEANDVDKQPETDIFNNTNLTGKDLIKDIESKTKTIEDAIESLTKKINDKKPKENIEYEGLEKIREQIKQFIEKVKEDEYYTKYKNQQYYNWDSNIIDQLNRQLKLFENVTSASDIQQISAAKLQLTNDLNKAKKDKFSCDIYCFVNIEVTKFTGDMRTDSSACLDSKKYWEEAEKEISKIRWDALDLERQGIQEDKLEKFKSDFRALKKPIEDKMNEIIDEFLDFWNKLSNTKSKTSYFIENKLKGKAQYKEGYDALNKLIQEANEILNNSEKHSNLELKNKEAEIQAKLLEYKNKYNMNK
ncbi:Lmp related protein [Metamycoplasma hominis ATCC 23114]|uniref:Lmp related protein n=2 Tax=Metamycoplasma hominis TaxID=2098 RepID=D1J899_METH1|nr:Lmp related protein [Metamycoplasma hominis]CAX37446.1 Lmp related protein [Metamycoplasma hominis ATCC 23114]